MCIPGAYIGAKPLQWPAERYGEPGGFRGGDADGAQRHGAPQFGHRGSAAGRPAQMHAPVTLTMPISSRLMHARSPVSIRWNRVNPACSRASWDAARPTSTAPQRSGAPAVRLSNNAGLSPAKLTVSAWAGTEAGEWPVRMRPFGPADRDPPRDVLGAADHVPVRRSDQQMEHRRVPEHLRLRPAPGRRDEPALRIRHRGCVDRERRERNFVHRPLDVLQVAALVKRAAHGEPAVRQRYVLEEPADAVLRSGVGGRMAHRHILAGRTGPWQQDIGFFLVVIGAFSLVPS